MVFMFHAQWSNFPTPLASYPPVGTDIPLSTAQVTFSAPLNSSTTAEAVTVLDVGELTIEAAMAALLRTDYNVDPNSFYPVRLRRGSDSGTE